MKKPMVRIHDVQTDEIIDREMTDEEYEIHLARLERFEQEKADLEAKETRRASALAKLAALGLTEDEIAAL